MNPIKIDLVESKYNEATQKYDAFSNYGFALINVDRINAIEYIKTNDGIYTINIDNHIYNTDITGYRKMIKEIYRR